MPDGILMIDGFNWSELQARSHGFRSTAERYQAMVEETIRACHGTVWNVSGDCTVACGFPDIDRAVNAAIGVQQELTSFNRDRRRNGTRRPLIVRIGVTRGVLPDISKQRRNVSRPKLNEVGHLEKDCPPGCVRISGAAFEALRFGRERFRPALRMEKSQSAGSYVWIERMLTPLDEGLFRRLSTRQRSRCPLVVTSEEDLGRMRKGDLDFRSLRDVFEDAFVVVGETRPPTEAGAVSHSAATSDAVGILEVLSALPSYPRLMVGVDEWTDSEDMAAQRHIVVIGSPAVNLYAYVVNAVTPAGFIHNNHGPLRIRVSARRGQRTFPSRAEHSTVERYYGLVLLTRNPLNPRYYMLWVAGISGMATQAAARFVRDLVLNPTMLDQKSVDRPRIAVVEPKWAAGWQAKDYQGNWRVNDYSVVCLA